MRKNGQCDRARIYNGNFSLKKRFLTELEGGKHGNGSQPSWLYYLF